MGGDLWTRRDLERLRNSWGDRRERAKLRKLLHRRTRKACYLRAHLLGLSLDRAWTPEEDAALRRTYERTMPANRRVRALLRAVPGRSLSGIRNRARDLGLRPGSCRPWTAEENAYLMREWGDTGLRVMCARLRRTRAAVCHRARDLGLRTGPGGVPAGYLSVSALSRRSGYPPRRVQRVLAEANVRLYQTDGLEPARFYHKLYADADDALEALEAYDRWLRETETPSEAARRHGLYQVTLYGWLEDAGLARRVGRGQALRLPVADIDRVVAERLPGRERHLAARRAA